MLVVPNMIYGRFVRREKKGDGDSESCKVGNANLKTETRVAEVLYI